MVMTRCKTDADVRRAAPVTGFYIVTTNRRKAVVGHRNAEAETWGFVSRRLPSARLWHPGPYSDEGLVKLCGGLRIGPRIVMPGEDAP